MFRNVLNGKNKRISILSY